MVISLASTALWPLIVYFGLVVFTVVSMIGISFVLGQHHQERRTGEPYESGNVPTGSARLRFPVKYYLVAMFFVIFDLEAAFLFAWAVSVRESGWLGFFEALVFVSVLLIALFYLWRQGALQWSSTANRDRTKPQPSIGQSVGDSTQIRRRRFESSLTTSRQPAGATNRN